MTKRRAPATIGAALARIAGQLPGDWAGMAELVGRAPRTVRNWGDPDTPEQIPLDAAIALDLAYQEAGGSGAPLHETYTIQLDLAGVDRFASRHALARLAADYIRESGEAGAALVNAAQPGADHREFRAAEREVLEALTVLQRAISQLASTAAASEPVADVHPSTGPPGRADPG